MCSIAPDQLPYGFHVGGFERFLSVSIRVLALKLVIVQDKGSPQLLEGGGEIYRLVHGHSCFWPNVDGHVFEWFPLVFSLPQWYQLGHTGCKKTGQEHCP